jgi:hypothetical protein
MSEKDVSEAVEVAVEKIEDAIDLLTDTEYLDALEAITEQLELMIERKTAELDDDDDFYDDLDDDEDEDE